MHGVLDAHVRADRSERRATDGLVRKIWPVGVSDVPMINNGRVMTAAEPRPRSSQCLCRSASWLSVWVCLALDLSVLFVAMSASLSRSVSLCLSRCLSPHEPLAEDHLSSVPPCR